MQQVHQMQTIYKDQALISNKQKALVCFFFNCQTTFDNDIFDNVGFGIIMEVL